ncbi:MAG: hypothetical protein M3Y12_14330 [Bacteroidota bacterium]|nr:hypothetical protein [Bacteroidota bacterium]
MPAPTPNELVKFAGTDFFFYKNSQPTSSGTYLSALVSPACGGSPEAGLRFIATSGTKEAVLTLTGNTLTLSYGGPCDAPVDTYQRQP